MNFNKVRGGWQGFTLIELLVVIAVIGLLAALFMPALSDGLDRARRMKCQSNLRQIGLAVAAYADTYDQDLPRYQKGNLGRHSYWGQDKVGLERALADILGSTKPADADKATGNGIFICPASSLRWNSKISQYAARGGVGDNNTYEGLVYNYRLSTLNTDPKEGSKVPRITKVGWYINPVGMPFQFCSMRLTMDPTFAAFKDSFAARSWHGEQSRPVVYMDGHVKTLTRPEYTQHGNEIIITAKLSPNINYNPRHSEFLDPDLGIRWSNGGDFAIVGY